MTFGNMIRGDMIPRNLVFSVVAMILIATGIGIYVWRVRGHEVGAALTPASATHAAPPASGPTEPATLYVAHDDPGVLRAELFRIPLPSGRQQRAEDVLRNLVGIYEGKSSPHPLGAGSEVRDVYLVEPDLAVIDVNSAFSTGHPSGVLAEELTVASLIETLSANVSGIARVKILVDGKTQETLAGHADLADFYDVAAVHELAQELEAGQ
ncbi:MAG: GerMN domain-containing protein [Terriglobales bacterium]